MGDDKAPGNKPADPVKSAATVKPAKPAVSLDDYPEELRLQLAIQLGSELSKTGIAPQIMTNLGTYMIDMQAQKDYALLGRETYRKGANEDLRKAIDKLEPALPPVKTPTKVGIFVAEDSSKTIGMGYHGFAAASITDGVYAKMAGTQTRAIPLLNRFVHELGAGKNRIADRPPIKKEDVKDDYDKMKRLAQTGMVPDLAEEMLQKKYKDNSVNVFSISQVGTNLDMVDADSRSKAVKKLDDYYGSNAIYVIGNGNSAPNNAAHSRHNAVHQHPTRTLLVGALHTSDVTVGKSTFPVFTGTDYSQWGADVTVAVPDLKTGYTISKKMKEGDTIVADRPLSGTSFAAPHAAAGVGRLMERFAKSKENPDAVLTPEQVLLAIKQTSQQVPVGIVFERIEAGVPEIRGVAIPIKPLPPVKDTFVFLAKTDILPSSPFNGRLVHPSTGNGRADFEEAWKMLEAMENRVKDTQANTLPDGTTKAYVRERVTIPPSALVFDKELPRDGEAGTDRQYKVTMDSPHFADTGIIEIHSKELAKAVKSGKAKLLAIAPSGERIELTPSISLNKDVDFVVAKIPAVQGMPIKGEWKIVSTEKLDKVSISFPSAMQADDVGVVIKPDLEAIKKRRLRNSDLREFSPHKIDPLLENGPLDLSQTAFPQGYLELTLLNVMEEAKEAKANNNEVGFKKLAEKAQQLANSGYPLFDTKNPAFIKAVGDLDSKATVKAMADGPTQLAMIRFALEQGGKEKIKALTDLGIDLKAKDADGRTILFFTEDEETLKALKAAEPALEAMKDNKGQSAEEFRKAESQKSNEGFLKRMQKSIKDKEKFELIPPSPPKNMAPGTPVKPSDTIPKAPIIPDKGKPVIRT